MATPLSDALDKLVVHIRPIADQLGVGERISKYPKALMEHLITPAIDLYPLPEDPPLVQGIGGQLIIQHRFHFRLQFYSEELMAETKFEDSYKKLEAIQDYLIRHLNVADGYDIGLSDSDSFDGLNINMGEIFTAGGIYEGGYIDIPLKVQTIY